MQNIRQGCSSVVKHLSTIYYALGLILNTINTHAFARMQKKKSYPSLLSGLPNSSLSGCTEKPILQILPS